MTKIVINADYGGFGLSTEATRLYLQRKGLEWTEETASFGPSFYVGGEFFSAREIPRADPDLVAVVEELEHGANGRGAALQVHDLEPGTLYLIDEYDGCESIQTRDGTEWSVA